MKRTKYEAIQQPVLTKKSFEQQKKRIYVFYVHTKANKPKIRKGIEDYEKQFGRKVEIEKIRTCLVKSVKQKTSLLRKFPGSHTKLKKKAYVQLKPGYRLTILE